MQATPVRLGGLGCNSGMRPKYTSLRNRISRPRKPISHGDKVYRLPGPLPVPSQTRPGQRFQADACRCLTAAQFATHAPHVHLLDQLSKWLAAGLGPEEDEEV